MFIHETKRWILGTNLTGSVGLWLVEKGSEKGKKKGSNVLKCVRTWIIGAVSVSQCPHTSCLTDASSRIILRRGNVQLTVSMVTVSRDTRASVCNHSWTSSGFVGLLCMKCFDATRGPRPCRPGWATWWSVWGSTGLSRPRTPPSGRRHFRGWCSARHAESRTPWDPARSGSPARGRQTAGNKTASKLKTKELLLNQ